MRLFSYHASLHNKRPNIIMEDKMADSRSEKDREWLDRLVGPGARELELPGIGAVCNVHYLRHPEVNGARLLKGVRIGWVFKPGLKGGKDER